MKVAIKSVIKSSFPQFQCFGDQQVIFRAGNTICIQEIGKPECQFICLNKQMDQLFTFKAMPNLKGVFTAERVDKDIQLVAYTIEGERKSISFIADHSFLAELQKIQLLVDEYDSNILYGAARTKQTVCVFLADFGKGKVMATGFLQTFEDIKVDIRDNMTLSICGNNAQPYFKTLQFAGNQWQISQQMLKKIPGLVFQHELLPGGRRLLVSKKMLYVLEDYELIKTIDFSSQGSISEVVKLSKGLLIRLSDDTLRLMVEDSDQISFLMVGTVQLDLQNGHSIVGIHLSHNNEQVWLKTTKNDLFVWRCDNIGLEISHSDLVFVRVDVSCSQQHEGSISISSTKKCALLTGLTFAVIWSIENRQCVLASDFHDSSVPEKKVLFSGAINPDGNSIILGFEDRLKIYKILFTKLKLHCQFPIKRCQNIVYSHGGQLVACKYGKGINSSIVIINLLRLNEVSTLKIQAQTKHIFWNQLDDELIVVTDTKNIQIYKVGEHNRLHNIKFQENIVHARLDYKSRRLLVSLTRKIVIIEGGTIIQEIPAPISNFHHIFPLYGMYFLVSTNGVLYWSYSLKFQTIHQLSLFHGSPFNLLCRSSNLVAYTSFDDIMVLKVQRGLEGQTKKRLSDEVVMLEKEEVLGLFQKVRDIQGRFDVLSSTYTIKLEQERQNYSNAVEKIKQNYMNEIIFLNNKYQQLSTEKCKQQKESEAMFSSIEYGQLRNVDQIQRMYERKYQHQKQKLMNMEQNSLREKNIYQQLLKDLEAKYHKEVEIIRNQYATQLNIQNNHMQKSKESHLNEKKIIEVQLLNLEEQTQMTLLDMQMSKDAMISQLKESLKKLEEENQSLLVKLQTQEYKVEKLGANAKGNMNDLKRLEIRLDQAQNRIKLLEGEIGRKNQMIEERDQKIKEQGHQIGDLQKAKYVLSFRTTEIRKQLQPKQGMIDKLKSQLLKIDEEYRELKKRNFEMQQKIQKLQTISGITKRENSDLKISLKYKERLHDQLCSEIFMVVNTMDPKDWNSQFVTIYQTYIKEDRHKNRQKDQKDDTREEISRHLMHVEQSLMHVSAGNDKIIKGKEKEVVRKMKENSQLVFELNVMRKKQNQYHKEKKQLVSENARLKRQVDESVKTTTRTRTANTGHSKRFIPSRDLYSRDKNTTIDISDLSVSKRDMKQLKKEKTRLASARRTLMLQDDMKQKGSKMFDLARELQLARTTIQRQDRMIQQLNHRLLGMPEFEG